MAKFKEGDKVRCVQNEYRESVLTLGKVYTVRLVNPKNEGLVLDYMDTEPNHPLNMVCDPRCFEHAEGSHKEGWHDARSIQPIDGDYVVASKLNGGEPVAGWFSGTDECIGAADNRVLLTWSQVDRWRMLPNPPESRDEGEVLAREIFGGNWERSGNALMCKEYEAYLEVGESCVRLVGDWTKVSGRVKLVVQCDLPCKAALERTLRKVKRLANGIEF